MPSPATLHHPPTDAHWASLANTVAQHADRLTIQHPLIQAALGYLLDLHEQRHDAGDLTVDELQRFEVWIARAATTGWHIVGPYWADWDEGDEPCPRVTVRPTCCAASERSASR